jgi:2-polyprenyl-3-methyl-5-hydroxy-6-metoxy-1,4-benzoquinol methylase
MALSSPATDPATGTAARRAGATAPAVHHHPPALDEPDSPLETTSCHLCGGTRHTPLLAVADYAYGTPGTFTEVRCDDCGLIFLNPRLRFHEILRRYPGDYVSSHMTLKRHGDSLSGRIFEQAVLRGETARVDEIAKRHPVDPGTRILDIGCGNATFLYAARLSRGADVTGVEVSADCCRYARDYLGLSLVEAPFEDATLDGPFDVITMWHYLEHEYDPLTTLARCMQLLREDGLFVVQVPNVASLGARLFGRFWNGWDTPRHTLSFSRTTLAAMLRRCRLEPVEMAAPWNAWGAVMSLRLALGLGLRVDPARRFWSLAVQNALTAPFEIASHLTGGEWITCYARRAKDADA